MENSKILKLTGAVLSTAGAITLGVGLYLRGRASDMISALKSGASLFGYSSSTYTSISAWDNKLSQGNTVIVVGVAIIVLGVALLYIGFLKGNEGRYIEKRNVSTSQTEGADITNKLKKLDELKSLELISDEEYAKKREEILSEL